MQQPLDCPFASCGTMEVMYVDALTFWNSSITLMAFVRADSSGAPAARVSVRQYFLL